MCVMRSLFTFWIFWFSLPISAASVRCDLQILNQALASFDSLLGNHPMLWQSSFTLDGKPLSREPLSSIERGEALIEATFSSQDLRNEILAGVGLGGPSPDLRRFFSIYPYAYDRAIHAIDGYLESALAVCKNVSLDGRILDLGSLTGTTSALCLQYPAGNSRTMVAIDQSREALAVAQNKLALASGNQPYRFEISLGDVADSVHYQRPFTSAIMLNVAYLLDDEKMDTVFQEVGIGLPSGGTFVLVDVRSDALSEAGLLKWLKANARNMVRNGGRATEFDTVFMGAMNYVNVLTPGRTFPRLASDFIRFGQKHGLHLKELRTINFQGANLYVFRK